FSHIWNGGYYAGYYAYLWSEVLDDDAYAWFTEHGGMTRANGRRFRDMLLSRGGTGDMGAMYRAFRVRDPEVGPLLEERGLQADQKEVARNATSNIDGLCRGHRARSRDDSGDSRPGRDRGRSHPHRAHGNGAAADGRARQHAIACRVLPVSSPTRYGCRDAGVPPQGRGCRVGLCGRVGARRELRLGRDDQGGWEHRLGPCGVALGAVVRLVGGAA